MDLTEVLNGFLSWAWERHHNVLSWYIRPLFLLPFCYFAYRRSVAGIVLTLVALATSMFWFPTPERVDPRVEEFLAFEREWLTAEWTLAKIATTLLVPLILGILCLAFWRRSLVWGLIVINVVAIGKVAWGVIDGGGAGWTLLPPALLGLVVCNAAVLYVAHEVRLKGASTEHAVERSEKEFQACCPDHALSEQGGKDEGHEPPATR